jgi:hypothetical protein
MGTSSHWTKHPSYFSQSNFHARLPLEEGKGLTKSCSRSSRLHKFRSPDFTRRKYHGKAHDLDRGRNFHWLVLLTMRVGSYRSEDAYHGCSTGIQPRCSRELRQTQLCRGALSSSWLQSRRIVDFASHQPSIGGRLNAISRQFVMYCIAQAARCSFHSVTYERRTFHVYKSR